MAVARKTVVFVCLLGLLSCSVDARAQSAAKSPAQREKVEASAASSPAAAQSQEAAPSAGAEATPAEEEVVDKSQAAQYPFRDLPADVLRDFPGLCFGSTALRLFQIGQSWSLNPFCGVATCLVSRDGYHLIERVQDCGPQPKRNAKCQNVNLNTEAAFPACCPRFVCEDGVELEYPTQEELQQLAQEAAQAAVRAQYDNNEPAEESVRQTARVAQEEEADEAESEVAESEAQESVDPEVAEPEVEEAAESEAPEQTEPKEASADEEGAADDKTAK